MVKNKDIIVSKLNNLRMAPRKTRLLAGILKNLPVESAKAQLFMSPRRAASPLLKLLLSAIADAKHNYHLDTSKLFIKEVLVNEGPKWKRWMPRARGSVSQIQKKTSHVVMVLGVSDKLKQPQFTVQIPKKAKKEAKKPLKEKKEKKMETKPGAETQRPSEKPGFFKKVFRRKSI